MITPWEPWLPVDQYCEDRCPRKQAMYKPSLQMGSNTFRGLIFPVPINIGAVFARCNVTVKSDVKSAGRIPHNYNDNKANFKTLPPNAPSRVKVSHGYDRRLAVEALLTQNWFAKFWGVRTVFHRLWRFSRSWLIMRSLDDIWIILDLDPSFILEPRELLMPGTLIISL